MRKKLVFPDLEPAVHRQNNLFNPSVILIEDKASGAQLIQRLVEAGLSKVTRYKPDDDKIMRLHAQTAMVENGFVHLPRDAHWLADYLHELTVFPNGRDDDEVDSTSQALAWTKQRRPGWGIIEYTRREAERVKGRPLPATERLKAPPGITHVYAMSGHQHMVQNGLVTVPEENVPGLLSGGFARMLPTRHPRGRAKP